MEYILVFRKNKFVGLYNMTKKRQVFNTTMDLLQDSLYREFGSDNMTNVKIIFENEERINPLSLPTLEEYLKTV